MRASWPRRASVVVLACSLATAVCGVASAQFRDTTSSGGLPVSTAQLAPPTGLTATAGCVLLTHKVDLRWTPTVSSFASGYRVYRRAASGSTWSLLGTVGGAATSSYSDSTVAASTSYDYAVESYRGGWSARTAAVGVTTRSVCLL